MSSRKFKVNDTNDFKTEKKNGKAESEKKAEQAKRMHKVELQTLYLSEDCIKEIMKTLSSIHGQGFVLKDRSTYTDKGVNLRQHYWVDHGNLIVQGVMCSKNKDDYGVSKELVNSFALDKLQSYGFYKSHCSEALKYTDGDVGTALELLASRYFNLPLNISLVTKDETEKCENTLPGRKELSEEDKQRLEELRNDEKDALMSIFEGTFEEKVKNRVWVLHLKLDYLLELFRDKLKKKGVNDPDENLMKTRKKKVEYCKFYAKGQCKYNYNCRYSHDRPEPKWMESEEEKVDYLFHLELRFPEDCRYPEEPGFLFLTTDATYIPPETLLQLTNRLIKEAKMSAECDCPCMYNAAQLLLDNEKEITSIALGTYEMFLDSNRSLLTDGSETKSLEEDEEEDHFEENNSEETVANSGEITMDQRLRENAILSRRFREKCADHKYKKILDERRTLPIFDKIDDIIEAVKKNQVVVISGETGCGKSTQIPQFILDAWLVGYGPGKKSNMEIICTQPRRISAIGVAERVAQERVERIGSTVGYQIRLESKVSSNTRLTFCTTGILLRKLESDPNLNFVTHIIVDEVHERSVESDFLLMILRDMMIIRPDLKIILMSATLNAELFSEYFGNAPTMHIPGKTFPVDQYFLEDVLDHCNYVMEENSQYARIIKRKSNESDMNSLACELATANLESEASYSNPKTSDENLTLTQLYARYHEHDKLTVKTLYLMDPEKINNELIESVLMWIVEGRHSHPRKGSILIFLPGMAEITSLHDQLSSHSVFSPREGRFILIPLHSSLSSEEQAAVFKKTKPGVRKIVLSTNIAETSVTIDDCVFVIDTGKMKERRFDTNKNMESLDTVWVSRANALQRKGRAGRVMPGVCIHLYTSFRYHYQFDSQPVPEIHRVPLEQLLLRIKILQMFAEKDVHSVLGSTLEPPNRDSIDSALERLKNVGALTVNKELTPLGCHLAALPVDVRIGKLMLFGAIFCCVDSALTIAACLNFKSPFVSPFSKREDADAKKKAYNTGNSDHLTMLKAYRCWNKEYVKNKRGAQVYAQEHYLSHKTLVTLGEIKQQFLELLTSIGFIPNKINLRKSNVDQVLEVTGTEMNANGENTQLLLAILCAALYPNVAKVLTPEKLYFASANGAVQKELKAGELKFKTKTGGYVHIHPTSVNYSAKHFSSPYLVYQERVKTSREFIRDCSMVPMLPFILFSGCSLQVELHYKEFAISLDDGWIVFAVQSQKVAELLQLIREELIKLLEEKIGNPKMNLLTDSRGKSVIRTIVQIVTKG